MNDWTNVANRQPAGKNNAFTDTGIIAITDTVKNNNNCLLAFFPSLICFLSQSQRRKITEPNQGELCIYYTKATKHLKQNVTI